MHEIVFYRDIKGKEPVADYIRELSEQQGKDARIKLNKIRDYIKVLSEYGTLAGHPYVKHLEGVLWELRPLQDRIIFAILNDGKYILLHHFMKQTKKTPRREILLAMQRLNDLRERMKENE